MGIPRHLVHLPVPRRPGDLLRRRRVPVVGVAAGARDEATGRRLRPGLTEPGRHVAACHAAGVPEIRSSRSEITRRSHCSAGSASERRCHRIEKSKPSTVKGVSRTSSPCSFAKGSRTALGSVAMRSEPDSTRPTTRKCGAVTVTRLLRPILAKRRVDHPAGLAGQRDMEMLGLEVGLEVERLARESRMSGPRGAGEVFVRQGLPPEVRRGLREAADDGLDLSAPPWKPPGSSSSPPTAAGRVCACGSEAGAWPLA